MCAAGAGARARVRRRATSPRVAPPSGVRVCGIGRRERAHRVKMLDDRRRSCAPRTSRRSRPRARGDARGPPRPVTTTSEARSTLSWTRHRKYGGGRGRRSTPPLWRTIRRCEAAVASWTHSATSRRARVSKSADFPTAIRDVMPLVLAVERQLRDEGALRGDDAAALDDENPRRIASSRGSPLRRRSHPLRSSAQARGERRRRRRERSPRRDGWSLRPERGHLLGMLVRALLPVEAVAEVVSGRARPPQSATRTSRRRPCATREKRTVRVFSRR